MLTFWFLVALLAVLIIAAVASATTAFKCNSPGLGLLTFFLCMAIIMVCVAVYRVAAVIDHLPIQP